MKPLKIATHHFMLDAFVGCKDSENLCIIEPSQTIHSDGAQQFSTSWGYGSGAGVGESESGSSSVVVSTCWELNVASIRRVFHAALGTVQHYDKTTNP